MREMPLVSSLLDSAPSVFARMTVDKPLSLSPNPPDSAIGTISAEPTACNAPFARPPKLLGIYGPATHGLRTSTKNVFSLAARFNQVKKPGTRDFDWCQV